jgi:hypothetical protein
MQTYQVQLWPDGRRDGKDYQQVQADSAKEAAEKLYGHPLKETGTNYQIRAHVRSIIFGDGKAVKNIL